MQNCLFRKILSEPAQISSISTSYQLKDSTCDITIKGVHLGQTNQTYIYIKIYTHRKIGRLFNLHLYTACACGNPAHDPEKSKLWPYHTNGISPHCEWNILVLYDASMRLMQYIHCTSRYSGLKHIYRNQQVMNQYT